MMDLIWIAAAFLAGLYLPAPYEAVARSAASAVWAKIVERLLGGAS